MKTCFVLEGGALRGLYTAGILDYLYEKNVDIDCIIGVSAGALFGVNYFSNQPGRVLRYNKKYCNDDRYISLKSLITTGNIVNKKFAYYKVTKELDPFDEVTYEKNKKDYYAVCTNIETGKPEYIKIDKPVDQLEVLRASSAMPYVSRIVKIDNNRYLDGAIGDSIPVLKAIEMGYDKIVVVLTQPFDYQKNELTLKELKNSIKKYKKYPYFVKALFDRPAKYNESLKEIKELEKEKRIFVIRPSKSVEINPIKKTQKELQNVYDLGKEDMHKLYSRLNTYLKK